MSKPVQCRGTSRSTAVSITMMLLVAAAACSADSEETESAVVRDSAGIRIVENAAPRLRGERSWRIADRPVADIGGSEDSTEMLFRVAGAVVLSDGRIVIAHGPAPMLRWYSPAGAFLVGAGRPGGGPGEFGGGESAWIHALWPMPGDSVATWEHSARRMQVFDPAGRYARAITIDLPPHMPERSYPQISGRLQDGFVAFLRKPYTTGALGVATRDTFAYLRYDDNGHFVGVLARLPGFVSFTMERQVRGMTYRGEGRPPFALMPAAWPQDSLFYYGSGNRFEISVYDTAGRLRQIIRRKEGPRQLTREMIAEHKRASLASRPPEADRAEWERALNDAIFPDSVPAYRRIRVDRAGALWVQEYDLPGATTVTWSVFERDGSWLTDVVVPKAVEIRDIGRDYILVLARDELDVERIRRYALTGRN